MNLIIVRKHGKSYEDIAKALYIEIEKLGVHESAQNNKIIRQ